MIYFYFFIFIFVFLYIFLILIFAIAWYERKNIKNNTSDIAQSISIIVAFRNEEINILNLCNSLLNQKKVVDFEIIFINDHSIDKSLELLSNFEPKIIIVNLPENLLGKKEALRYGLKFAKGEILLFTDADCIVPENWANSMCNYLIKNSLQMLCAPVEFISEKGFLNKIFQLEFLSMTGSGAAGFFINCPFICNGANYAIRKEIFVEASYFFNDKFSSGDDVFLLHYVSEKYKIDFIKSKDTIIKTIAPKNLRVFFLQRIRWASKTSGYKNVMTIFTLIINVLYNIIILLTCILIILKNNFFIIFITLFIIKFIVDLIFMIPILYFHEKMNLLKYIPIMIFLYPFYVIITGILSLFLKPKWKGRKIKRG
ncbi:MAG: glycosyltransferase [Bacteroidales bacterium]|jgi:cellulose synthase/poly-beta-1,6-N-acetylglucosamine synthase-like glycosyltransferase|nr:glycosyltransferase [Bacteroidales bacterium]